MFSLNYYLVPAVVLLYLFIGYSNGTEVNTLFPPRDGYPEIIYKIDGALYHMPNHDDLIFYTPKYANKISTSFCTEINPATADCYPDKIKFFENVRFDNFFNQRGISRKYWILKPDIVVLYPTRALTYQTDVVTFNFPAYSVYFNGELHLKVLISIQQARQLDASNDKDQFQVFFEDPEDKCRNYRAPEIWGGRQMFTFNLFANKKWTKYAYYFIKNNRYICAYSFEYEDLFSGADGTVKNIQDVGFQLIKTYPTENYALDYFCVDPLYGTFVSLYWNKQSNSFPEAHYYLINENDMKNFQLIDRMILTDFNMDVLRAIFRNEYDYYWFPAFSCYGRQINIWFKMPGEMRAFNGLWKNETEFITYFQNLQNVTEESDDLMSMRKIWRAKKSYIQYERPVGRFDAPSLPETITIPPILSSTTPSGSITSDDSSATNNDTNFNQVTLSSVPGINKSRSDSLSKDDKCSNGDLYLWLLIVFIIIDVIEAIILVILVILKFRGAKKLKEAMARKKSLKPKTLMKKKSKAKSRTKKKPVKMPWKKAKKSIKKTTVTTKTEDVGTGMNEDGGKKTTTTVDQSKYYTANQSFYQVSKK